MSNHKFHAGCSLKSCCDCESSKVAYKVLGSGRVMVGNSVKLGNTPDCFEKIWHRLCNGCY